MTTPTLTILESLLETMTKQHAWLTNVAAARLVQAEIDRVKSALAAQPQLPEPVGLARCEGTNQPFTHAVFKAEDAPHDTPLYTAAQLQQAVEQAKPVVGESVLVDGTAYDIPAPVAAELLRLNIELKQAQAKREPMTQEQMQEIFLANGFTVKAGQDDLKDYVYAAGRAIEAHHGIGDKA